MKMKIVCILLISVLLLPMIVSAVSTDESNTIMKDSRGDPLDDNLPPSYISIETENNYVLIHNEFCFTVVATDPEEDNIYYYIDWGYGSPSIDGPYASGEEVRISHDYEDENDYVIIIKPLDEFHMNPEDISVTAYTVATVRDIAVTYIKGGFGIKALITNNGNLDAWVQCCIAIRDIQPDDTIYSRIKTATIPSSDSILLRTPWIKLVLRSGFINVKILSSYNGFEFEVPGFRIGPITFLNV